MKQVEQFTKEQAVKIYESGIWNDMTARQIVEMQLPQKRMCVPYGVFLESLSDAFGRPVLNIEGQERLCDEFFNGAEPPTLDEILASIPGEKVVVFKDEIFG